jgi:high-affinity iron transporter
LRVIPTFVIGLREGLEASLIVGIIAAFLRRTGRPDALKAVWVGVAAAVAICLGIGVGIEALNSTLPHKQQEGLETVVALIAVATVTWMVVWMKRNARGLKTSLEESAAGALAQGTTYALVGMAFFAVLREGFETAVFLLAAFQSTTTPVASGAGVVLGIASALVLGILIYRGGVRIDLARFFRVTGFVLVLVAAGLVSSALHSAHEAGWIIIGQARALDLTWLVDPGSIRASLITGMLGLQPQPTVAEVVGWLLYAIPMSLYVLWPSTPRIRRPAPVATTQTQEAVR